MVKNVDEILDSAEGVMGFRGNGNRILKFALECMTQCIKLFLTLAYYA